MRQSMNKSAKIYVAWHTWLLWSAIIKRLQKEWYTNLLLATRQDLDLLDQKAVYNFYETQKPDYVIVCAAKVWGVQINAQYPYDMLYQNIQIQSNIINGWYSYDVKKLLFIASSTIYPSECEQPISEKSLLQWPLDSLHESYGLAKICGIKLCEKLQKQSGKNFFSLVPTNIYGEWDHFEEEKAHVISALISRFHKAKQTNAPEVVVWWSGKAQREFLYVDDVADACIFFLSNDVSSSFINIGSDEEISIKNLSILIKEIVWYKWDIIFDETKPEGRLRRKLDTSLANSLWWKPKTHLAQWIRKTYDYFLSLTQ